MKKPSFFPWTQIISIIWVVIVCTLKRSATMPSWPHWPSKGFWLAAGLSLSILLKLYLLKRQRVKTLHCILPKYPKLISKFVHPFLRSCSLGITVGHLIVWHFVFAWWIYLQEGSSASWRYPILVGRPRIVQGVLERRGRALRWEERRQLRGEGEIADGTSYYSPIIWKQLQIKWICVSSENALILVFVLNCHSGCDFENIYTGWKMTPLLSLSLQLGNRWNDCFLYLDLWIGNIRGHFCNEIRILICTKNKKYWSWYCWAVATFFLALAIWTPNWWRRKGRVLDRKSFWILLNTFQLSDLVVFYCCV